MTASMTLVEWLRRYSPGPSSRISQAADAIETAEKALEHILAGALSLPRFADEEARDALAKLRDNR